MIAEAALHSGRFAGAEVKQWQLCEKRRAVQRNLCNAPVYGSTWKIQEILSKSDKSDKWYKVQQNSHTDTANTVWENHVFFVLGLHNFTFLLKIAR